jgi:hypothetical protein
MFKKERNKAKKRKDFKKVKRMTNIGSGIRVNMSFPRAGRAIGKRRIAKGALRLNVGAFLENKNLMKVIIYDVNGTKKPKLTT